MNILFICKHNRFRSKVAEAIFKKLDKKDRVRSRGIIKDVDVADSVLKIMKEKVIEIKDKKSRSLTRKDIEWADLIVIVADNLWIRFPGKKVLVWKVPDVSQKYFRGIKIIIDDIEKRVKKLVRLLGKKFYNIRNLQISECH